MAEIDVVPAARADAWWTRRRRITAAAAAVLVAVIVAAAVIFAHWLHSLKLPLGSSFGFEITRSVGATFYVPDVVAPEGNHAVTVDLRSITPHIRQNTADATVTIVSCAQTGQVPAVGYPNLPSGSHVKPFRAGTFNLSARRGADAVAVRITLRHPGRLVIDRFDFTYRDGIRGGSGTSDISITATSVTRG